MLRLVDDWRRWHRLWSIQLAAIGAAIQAALLTWPSLGLQVWAMMPQDMKDMLPARAAMLIPLVFFIASMAARLIKQKPHGE